MTVVALLLALFLAGCGSAPNGAHGRTNPRPGSGEQQSGRRSLAHAQQTACAYPDGRILVVENRLQATKIVNPTYPPDAKLRHIEGRVEVTVLVDQNGDVVWACGKGDSALTNCAEQAARQFKFPRNFGMPKPGISGRTPVVLYFDFRMDGARGSGAVLTPD